MSLKKDFIAFEKSSIGKKVKASDGVSEEMLKI